MALTTYNELKTAIGDFLNRSDLTSVIPDFITLAESQFNRVLRTDDSLERDAAFTVSASLTDLPTGFREMKRIRITSVSPTRTLEYLSPLALADKLTDQADVAGTPQYYTIIGGKIQVAAAPGQSYTAEIYFHKSLTALSSAVNWLFQKHPDAYLYGSLVHSAPYLKDDERIPVWQNMLTMILAEIQMEGERMKYSGSTPRVAAKVIGG